jgi:hypothetical protein
LRRLAGQVRARPQARHAGQARRILLIWPAMGLDARFSAAWFHPVPTPHIPHRRRTGCAQRPCRENPNMVTLGLRLARARRDCAGSPTAAAQSKSMAYLPSTTHNSGKPSRMERARHSPTCTTRSRWKAYQSRRPMRPIRKPTQSATIAVV